MKNSPTKIDAPTPGEWVDETTPGALQTLAAPSQPKSSPGRALATVAALALAAGGGYWLRDHQSTAETTVVIANSTAPKPRQPIVVHIAGRVRHPGVYQLSEGARLRDVVARAGGVLPDGDANALNLAAFAEDGRKVEVPPRAAPSVLQSTSAPQPSSEPIRPRPKAAASKYFGAAVTPIRPPTQAQPAPKAASSPPRIQRPIDLNRATSQELEELPGIGPALAARIIAFREENGGFVSVDDLDDVDGIGEKRMETLRPLVEVN